MTRVPLPGFRALAGGALLVFAQTAVADRLITRNGETLQGTLVQESPDAVVFDSLTFGRLTVGRDAIVKLERAASGEPAASEEPAAAAPFSWSRTIPTSRMSAPACSNNSATPSAGWRMPRPRCSNSIRTE